MTDQNDNISKELEALEREGDFIDSLNSALKHSSLFMALTDESYGKIAAHAHAVHLEAGEKLMEKGGPSDSFYLVCRGEVSVISEAGADRGVMASIGVNESIGEMGVLLNQPRSATVIASCPTICARFEKKVFEYLFGNLPGFGLAIGTYLARRLQETSWSLTHKDYRENAQIPDLDVFSLLPLEFVQRHRLMPLKVMGNTLTLGITEPMVAPLLLRIEALLPGMEVIPVRMDSRLFTKTIEHYTAGTAAPEPAAPAVNIPIQNEPAPVLARLLRRMVEEGASDLHLSAGHRPRWRVDGQVRELFDLEVIGPREVEDLFFPLIREELQREFTATGDCDFSYAYPGVARFRVNMFQDRFGVGAVLRLIPETILTLDQIGMPPILKELCGRNKGLILVTGPTGSGKSTTLSAMVDHINRTFPLHILTMEDPIEFVHESRRCLVNQREIGHHSKSFKAALRASLREDPDIVLVGEIRDRETVELALELANTGHLVMGTLHTSTAVSTIDRIVDMFPTEQQTQVRSGLADSVQGIIAQTLCRKKGGGRVAALEILVNSYAMANLIREGKNSQIYNAMLTGKQLGNTLLN
ncbi:PilT/PilU family type 4a pilus ATPase, partial [Myxococcota bacterium]|nr:PilT/PilU family type 4a pilus ATPase [Myxococcota bacterium]